MNTAGGDVLILFNTVINAEDAGRTRLYLQIDGVTKATTQTKQDNCGQSYDRDSAGIHWLEKDLTAGTHIFKMRWSGSNGQMNPGGESSRVLTVMEI